MTITFYNAKRRDTISADAQGRIVVRWMAPAQIAQRPGGSAAPVLCPSR